ncbi:thioredoxin family protein [Flaviaesturariibacter aridisoli]|uniref:DUF255 domain-containing protein n=1 Tax=Flaviaesturariibacter aridisoli TaxID=2545761 RepID=A0A4R4E6B5_9BACT|nr:thioredoxin family protein [Flaviaesturariibacter aridisoli]TCZ74433.1 DUF255 domain-containing protein [Flaviaesturariibacter aridisoli]
MGETGSEKLRYAAFFLINRAGCCSAVNFCEKLYWRSLLVYLFRNDFMRAVAVFLMSLVTMGSIAQSPGTRADTTRVIASADLLVGEARKQALKEHKNVLVLFHASWCGWCKKMEKALDEPALKPLFDKSFVTVWLTVDETPERRLDENPGAKELLGKYGGSDLGIPYFIVFDPKGNRLSDSQREPGQNIGCPAEPEEVAYFVEVLKKTTNLTERELQAIAERFRKNKS